MIIVNMLRLHGESSAVATAWYGLLSGPVQSLVNMPVVAIISLGVAIVPSVSSSRATHDADAIMLKAGFASNFAIFWAYRLHFSLRFCGRYIVSRLSVIERVEPFGCHEFVENFRFQRCHFSAMQIYVSLLQALDKTKWAVLSLVCAIIVKTVLSLTLVSFIGILGGAIASLAMGAVALLRQTLRISEYAVYILKKRWHKSRCWCYNGSDRRWRQVAFAWPLIRIFGGRRGVRCGVRVVLIPFRTCRKRRDPAPSDAATFVDAP